VRRDYGWTDAAAGSNAPAATTAEPLAARFSKSLLVFIFGIALLLVSKSVIEICIRGSPRGF
jgi:hypothetical protein